MVLNFVLVFLKTIFKMFLFVLGVIVCLLMVPFIGMDNEIEGLLKELGFETKRDSCDYY